MNSKGINYLLAFFTALPLAFVLIFFGFLPLRFDAVVYTNNIVGEGTCSSYLTDSNTSFSYLYNANAYCGSELKTLRLFRLPYNVESVILDMYNIEEVDIISFDISFYNRTVTHLNKYGITHPFTETTTTAITSDEEPIVHVTLPEDEKCISISFPGSSIIPIYIWIAYGCLILLVTALLTFLVLFIFERLPGTQVPLMGISAIFLTMIMGCFICGSLPYVDYTFFLLNGLLLFAASLFINSLTLPWIGAAVVSAFTLVWYIANYFVIQFRNKPIMPADLKAIGTAKEVAGGYNLTPSWRIVVGVAAIAVFLTAIILVWKKTKSTGKPLLKDQIILRGIGVAAALVLMFLGVHNPAFSRLNTFQWDAKVLEGFHREGILLTFVRSAISARVERPEGYSREVVDSFLKDYQEDEKTDKIQPTRIIMIMNEAFSDLRTVGLDQQIDVMPFVDSLDENTTEGSLYVSIIGGGTCNTEFEALTGNTLAFLGSGAYPYTENVTKPLFSLATYFGNDQYVTEAFHASDAENWNRNIVYPNLGFGVFHPLEDYPNISKDSYMHGYITDSTDYAFIEQRDAENTGNSRFLFNVTIQNHAYYEHFRDVPEAETLEPYKDSLQESARVYLSMIKISDDSIKQLVEHYKDSEEPTMIIFFGDHQPSLSSFAQEGIYTDMQGYIDYFKSKFFIWTNYDTEEWHDAAISANYLPWLILERGNFQLPPYVQMLKEVYEKYPVISSQGVIDADGNVYDNVAVLMDDPLIRKYQYIQYANLFDEISQKWFEVE